MPTILKTKIEEKDNGSVKSRPYSSPLAANHSLSLIDDHKRRPWITKKKTINKDQWNQLPGLLLILSPQLITPIIRQLDINVEISVEQVLLKRSGKRTLPTVTNNPVWSPLCTRYAVDRKLCAELTKTDCWNYATRLCPSRVQTLASHAIPPKADRQIAQHTYDSHFADPPAAHGARHKSNATLPSCSPTSRAHPHK